MKLVMTRSTDAAALKKGAEDVGITPRQLEALAKQFGDRGLGTLFSQAAVLLAGEAPAPPKSSAQQTGALPTPTDLDQAVATKKAAAAQARTAHSADVGRLLVGQATKHVDWFVASGRTDLQLKITGPFAEEAGTAEKALREGLKRELPGVEIERVKVKSRSTPSDADGPGSAWVEAFIDGKVVDPGLVQKASVAREGWLAAVADVFVTGVRQEILSAAESGRKLPLDKTLGAVEHDYSGRGIGGDVLKLWGTTVEVPAEAVDAGFADGLRARVTESLKGTEYAATLSFEGRRASVRIDRAS